MNFLDKLTLEFVVLFWIFATIMFVIFMTLPLTDMMMFWVFYMIVMFFVAQGYLDFAMKNLINYAFHKECVYA